MNPNLPQAWMDATETLGNCLQTMPMDPGTCAAYAQVGQSCTETSVCESGLICGETNLCEEEALPHV